MRILWWLLAVIGIGITSIVLSEQGALDPANEFSLQVAAPIEGELRDLGIPTNDFLHGVFDRGDLSRENQSLRGENELLKVELARIQDAEQRFDELAKLLEVKEGRPEDEFRVANIIAVDPSNLKEAVAIDLGQDDGLGEGMVILGEGGSLVGTITDVFDSFCWVTLVTDPGSVINAMVQGVEARGVVSGDMHDDLALDIPTQVMGIEFGQFVVTSGLGGNYPRALLIGTIASVDNQPQALFTKAIVDPVLDLGRLESVLVLVSFTPSRLVTP